MSNLPNTHVVLKPYRDLPYGAKFRYQGTKDVWVRTQHNTIASWNGDNQNSTRQSLCCFCHINWDEDGNTLDTLVEVLETIPAHHHGEPVAKVVATGGPHDKEDRVLMELQAQLPPIGTKLYAYDERVDVRTIMLEVVPGEEGMGHEIYAKSVQDIQDLLTKQWDEIEELQEQLATLKQQGEVVAWVNSNDLITDGHTHSFRACSEQPGNGYVDGGTPVALCRCPTV